MKTKRRPPGRSTVSPPTLSSSTKPGRKVRRVRASVATSRRVPAKVSDNYLFAWSPRGAEAAVIYYPLIDICLLKAMDARKYLVEVAARLHEPVSHLTPQAVRETWEAAR
jgi:hypothetical protein